jgi:hypothetical protein
VSLEMLGPRSSSLVGPALGDWGPFSIPGLASINETCSLARRAGHIGEPVIDGAHTTKRAGTRPALLFRSRLAYAAGWFAVGYRSGLLDEPLVLTLLAWAEAAAPVLTIAEPTKSQSNELAPPTRSSAV